MPIKSLIDQHCSPYYSGQIALSGDDLNLHCTLIHDDWALDDQGASIRRRFVFKNYREAMAFANKVALIVERENHHPEMTIAYKTCSIVYTTHTLGGLSSNDFICAAKIDVLVE